MEPATGAGRKGFLFDLGACTGCQACQVACSIENQIPEGRSWREVLTFNGLHYPGVPVFHLSLACNHCADAPCMEHCPALAYRRDASTGAVLLDSDLCIGCKYCSWACPFDAPRYQPEAGVMSKCTFCNHRLAAGQEPACVSLCPTGALGFGDLETLPGQEQVQGFPEADCGPAIRFLPLPKGRRVPALGAPAGNGEVPEVRVPPPKVSLATEWPLVVFTLLAAVLVAAQAAAALGSLRLPRLAFVALALLNMGLASFHLGQKLRAWRAVLNLRRSWLSREILLYGLFVGLVVVAALFAPGSGAIASAAALVGLAALFAIDRVYDVLKPPRAFGLHSADVLLTGLLLTGILSSHLPSTVLVAGLKLVLYLIRKARLWDRGRETHPGWSLLRLGLGFLLPPVLALIAPEGWVPGALAGMAIGEVIDRCQFYAELVVPAPRRQMALDLLEVFETGDLNARA